MYIALHNECIGKPILTRIVQSKVLVMQVKQSGYPRLEEVYIFAVVKGAELPPSLRVPTNTSPPIVLHGKLVGVFIARTTSSAQRIPIAFLSSLSHYTAFSNVFSPKSAQFAHFLSLNLGPFLT